MKLARYSYNGTTSIGRVEGDRLIDLAALLPAGAADVAAVLALPHVLAEAAPLKLPRRTASPWTRCACWRPFCVPANSCAWA
ncbi:Rv2993c-like domain-containing protein [Pseudomonas baetica]|uniref:Rv2993c-like domain-containing protein n=1 Tax=Pseudomonas baetica TaxID=674054 RepID=UPI001EDCFB6D|nr:Rv2993c-like domain-containing protein [Pseudomonas baetica]